jgi:hypothetical protein
VLHLHAHGFVDGGYVRRLATDADLPLVNPYLLVANVLPSVQSWGSPATYAGSVALTRVTRLGVGGSDRFTAPPEPRRTPRGVPRGS